MLDWCWYPNARAKTPAWTRPARLRRATSKCCKGGSSTRRECCTTIKPSPRFPRSVERLSLAVELDESTESEPSATSVGSSSRARALDSTLSLFNKPGNASNRRAISAPSLGCENGGSAKIKSKLTRSSANFCGAVRALADPDLRPICRAQFVDIGAQSAQRAVFEFDKNTARRAAATKPPTRPRPNPRKGLKRALRPRTLPAN